MKNNKYANVFNDALKTMEGFASGNVVLGSPVVTPSGTTVIPVSKVTVGMISGKGEYGEVKLFSLNKNYPESNAVGGIATVKPVGFLVETSNKMKFISCPQDALDKTMESIYNLLEKQK